MIKEELKLFDKVEELIPSRLREDDVFKIFVDILKNFVEPIDFVSKRNIGKRQEFLYGNLSGPYALLFNYLRGTKNVFDLVETLCGVRLTRKYFPSKSFMSISISDTDREKFYSKYPKFIMSRYSERGQTWYRFGNFFSYKDDEQRNKSISYMIDLKTYRRYGYRSWLEEGGVRKPLVVYEDKSKSVEKVAEEVVEVRRNFVMRGFFTSGHRFKYGRFLTNHGARKRIYLVKVYHKYYDKYFEVFSRVVNYGIDRFMNVKFDEIAEKGRRVYFVKGDKVISDYYVGEFFVKNKNFFVRSEAYARLYLQAYVFDENVAVEWGRGFCFLNSLKYFRLPPFNVELWGRVWDVVNNKVWWKYAIKRDKSKLNKLVEILNDLRATSDRVYLYTRTKSELVADGTITAGMGYVVGDEKFL